ncbi:hypothetical protein F2Q70_00031869 [Brassica cretica]|uniref:Uncharacterized protein n=1 Tax=Brassica cretica TaxID=69181 RepID=A0A3N6RV23_BRACR|nr:hypothetical protein F2Q70_00031869 [Brassica cretica]KAF3598075.1 hypothetical protein DY000_02025260 [Brassica cretica]
MVSSCYRVAYMLLAEDVASWNELDRLSWDRERLRYEVNGSRSGFIAGKIIAGELRFLK